MRIHAAMATIPGRDESRRKAVESLAPQVDALVVHFNGYTQGEAREAMHGMPANCVGHNSQENFGDQMKFTCTRAPARTWRFACDDDVIYPPDFVKVLVGWADELEGPVSAHGALLTQPFTSYYRSRRSFHCTQQLAQVQKVDVLGTGVMCWRGDWWRPCEAEFPEPNMADIWAAIALRKLGFALHVVPHAQGWIRVADPGNEQTIYAASKRKEGSFMDTGDQQTQVILEHRALFGI